jgi:ankyrin repeat protein
MPTVRGETGLHWAAFAGHADIVRLLLQRAAPVDVEDNSYHDTPLGWALYAWGTSSNQSKGGDYYQVVARLAGAGAKLGPQWHDDDPARRRAAKKLQSDAQMLAALRGQMPPT